MTDWAECVVTRKWAVPEYQDGPIECG
jgi:hypothetical protein